MESWLLWVTLVQISGCTLHFNSPFSHNNRMTREHLHYYHMSVSKRKKKRPYKELPYVSTYFTLSYHNWGRLTHLLLDFGVSGDSDCKKKKLGGEVAAFSIFTLELLAIDLSNRLITLIEMGVCGLVVLWHGNTILVPSCCFFFFFFDDSRRIDLFQNHHDSSTLSIPSTIIYLSNFLLIYRIHITLDIRGIKSPRFLRPPSTTFIPYQTCHDILINSFWYPTFFFLSLQAETAQAH